MISTQDKREIKNIGIEFTPEIENRRQDYIRITNAFSAMMSIKTNTITPLDIGCNGCSYCENTFSLSNSVHDHLENLWLHINKSDSRVLRRLYPELRMIVNQKAYEREQLNLNNFSKA